jgi:DNA polymerase I-like protein with 3'-5' exonuclease and polymerase domains
MGRFNPRELLVIDTETTGLRFRQGDMPFAVPLCDENGNTWYTEWRVDPFTRQVHPDAGDIRFLRKLFSNERLQKVTFNRKFDVNMLRTVGLELAGTVEDAGVAFRVCQTLEQNYQLKPICERLGICDREDETRLQAEVERYRRTGRIRGWKLAEDCEADYWVPRAVDPSNNSCEEYALKDVYPRTLMLWLFCDRVLMADPEFPELRRTYEFEMREVGPVIDKIESRGIRIDRKRNLEMLNEALQKAERQEKQLNAMLVKDRKQWHPENATPKKKREPFNPDSPQQVRRVLYEEEPNGYGLACYRVSKKSREPSTDWKALREHLTHPFVQGLVQAKSARKAAGTYYGNYEDLCVSDPLNPGGYAIYPNLNQVGAAKSSRLSANDPNMQNVGDANNNPNSPAPIQAREQFGPRPGYRLYSLDWSGQEVRIFAYVANVELMLESIANGRDIPADSANLAWGGRGNPHALTAAAMSLELGNAYCDNSKVLEVWRLLGWSKFKARTFGFNSAQSYAIAERWLKQFKYDIVTAEKSIGKKLARTRAKNLTYAKIYGAGASGVMDMLYCTRREANETLARFDTIYPGIVEFCEEYALKARADGFIRNLFGRRLLIEREYAYRAVNYLVQGTAAEMMKRALIKCDRYLTGTGLDAHIVLSVHDEILFEIAVEHSYKWLLRGLRTCMESVANGVIGIPMPVGISRMCHSWDDKKELKL